MDEEHFAALIVGTAVIHAVGRGYRIGGGAERFLIDRAKAAARELSGAKPDQRVETALINVRALVDAMIVARPTAYATDPRELATNIIGELTLSEALAKLCPIWPFC